MLNIKIGLRYLKAKKRNNFISFISFISFGGIALAVSVLIAVMSVMNGFQRDLRKSILSMTSHAVVISQDGVVKNWSSIEKMVNKNSQVLGSAPYIEEQAMIITSFGSTGTLLRGVDPVFEKNVSDIAQKTIKGNLLKLKPGKFNIAIGEGMAQEFDLMLGDKINIIIPMTNSSIMGIIPRSKNFTVSAIFKVGMYEYDRKMVLINIKDAQVLYKMKKSVSGVRLKVKDMLNVYLVSEQLRKTLPQNLIVSDWTEQHANFFKAVKTEKIVMFIILSLIIMIATFNIISTMVMVVTDKESEIAILRTLGMQTKSISQIFLTQGIVIGLVGTLIGIILGVILSLNVEKIALFVEEISGSKLLAADVYYISEVPSQLLWQDVLSVGFLSFFMAILATLYPAYKASKVNPTEALRYE